LAVGVAEEITTSGFYRIEKIDLGRMKTKELLAWVVKKT
jgi:hypothetical protein